MDPIKRTITGEKLAHLLAALETAHVKKVLQSIPESHRYSVIEWAGINPSNINGVTRCGDNLLIYWNGAHGGVPFKMPCNRMYC